MQQVKGYCPTARFLQETPQKIKPQMKHCIHMDHTKMLTHHHQNLEWATKRRWGRAKCRWRVMAETRHTVDNSKLPVQMFCYQHIPQIARLSTKLVNRKLMSGRLNYQIANSCRGRNVKQWIVMMSYSSLCCNSGLAHIDGEEEEEEEEWPEVCCNFTFRQIAQSFSAISCSSALWERLS